MPEGTVIGVAGWPPLITASRIGAACNAAQASMSETCTCRPWPVVARAYRAAPVACAAYTPVTVSGTRKGIRRGVPSAARLIAAMPVNAWITESVAALRASGPLGPKPVTET